MNKPSLPSLKMESMSQALATIAGTVIAFLILGYLLIPGALSAHSSDTKQAAALAAQTNAINLSVAHGRQVAANPSAWNQKVSSLSSAFPTTPDDQSLTASVLSAANSTGVSGPGETRKDPVSAAGLLQTMSVAITGNGNQQNLIGFIAALQRQDRLVAIDGMTFNFAQNTVAATGNAFVANSSPPAVSK